MSLSENKPLLILLFVGVLMGALDIAIIGPALPAIQAEFDTTGRQLAVLFNAYVLGQLIGTQLLAKLSDRFGPRSIYIFSLVCFGGGSLLLVMAGEINALYAGRAIQGFGAGGIFPVATTVIAAQMSGRDRGPALGLIGSVWGLAFFIGPILGGIFLNLSWRWLFLVNLPIAGLLIAGAWRLLPKTGPGSQRPFDLVGLGTLMAAVVALVVAINNFDATDVWNSVTSFGVAALLGAVTILLPLFWFAEKRAADPIIRPGLLQTRQVALACVVAGGAGAMQTASVFYPAMAVASIGVSQSTAAFMLLPGVVISTLGSIAVGRLINVVGTRLLVLASLCLIFTSFMIYGRADLDVPTFLLANMISGLGSAGLIGAPLRWTILNESRPEERGAAQGLLSNITSVGRLIGAAVVGAVITSQGGGVPGYQAAFVGMGIFAIVLFAVATLLKSRSAEQLLSDEMPKPATA
ncbi:MAG: MFS transporter [Gammaproteobacteria bacterium]|nr:MFS transporter [Gammaproteobacteria bacterium]